MKKLTHRILIVFGVSAAAIGISFLGSRQVGAQQQGPPDGLAVARALAAELADAGFDLIFFGKHAFDTSAGVVGTATAELLGLPCVTAVSKLEIANETGVVLAKGKPTGRGRKPLLASLRVDGVTVLIRVVAGSGEGNPDEPYRLTIATRPPDADAPAPPSEE